MDIRQLRSLNGPNEDELEDDEFYANWSNEDGGDSV